MFWGIALKANRKYTQTVTKSFHISQAALDSSTSKGQVSKVFLTSQDEDFLICTLRKDTNEQVPLDLNFAVGDDVSFLTTGDGMVYLSGYLTDLDGYMDGEEEQEDSEEESQVPKKAKKVKIQAANGEDEDDEEDSDLNGEEEGDSSEDEDEDDDDEDESDSDHEIEKPKPKKAKLEKSVEANGSEKKPEPQKKIKDKKESNQQQNANDGKTLTGGVIVKDLKVGSGTEIKSGKRAQVYYEGRLKSNNKMFDSMKQGNGFKFKVGQGEVIKAWDVGIVGMKVGGKRRIICPPHMAYGARGSPPQIPPNSTLVFEIELKGVH